VRLQKILKNSQKRPIDISKASKKRKEVFQTQEKGVDLPKTSKRERLTPKKPIFLSIKIVFTRKFLRGEKEEWDFQVPLNLKNGNTLPINSKGMS
jgi:hypothetical protein